MTTIKDENGNPLIGYLNVGGVVVPRADLAKCLPDVARFERCLEHALAVNDHMEEHGKPPPIFFSWSRGYVDQIQTTMREVGSLHRHMADRIRDELAARAK